MGTVLAPRVATAADIASWVALARTVEPLFGPMPDIADHVRRGMERGTAIVIGEVGVVEAGMLLSRDDRPHEIHWLATAASSRGRGHASALVEYAMTRWPTGEITVVTFTEDEPGGQAARRLYERHGFVDQGRTTPAPDGGERDLYRLCRP